jgi:hypothetical protein
MVGTTTRSLRRHSAGGFAIGELIISTAIFSAVSAGLILGFVSLKRNYAATTDFAINHADQMRISDYLALDFRRALGVHVATNDTTVYIPSFYAPRVQGQAETSREVRMPVMDGKGGVFYGPVAKATATAPLPSCTYTGYTAASPARLSANGSGALVLNGYIVATGDTVFVKDQPTHAHNGLYQVTNAGSASTGWVLTTHAVKVRYYLAGSMIYRNQEGEPNQPTALAHDVQDFILEASDLGKVIRTSITFKPTFKSGERSQEIRTATAFHNTTLLRNNRGVY